MQKTIQSQLARYQMESPLSDLEIYQKKRNAWLNKEGLHLNAEQIKTLTKEHQWAIEIIGSLIYGKVVAVKIT